MAITFDASTNDTITDDSLTIAHTGTGSNLCALVAIFTNRTSDEITGVTYGGVAMTRGDAIQAVTTNFYGFWYYLLSAPSGAVSVVISAAESTQMWGIVDTYAGVLSIDATNKGTDATGNFAATLTPSDDSCWMWTTTRGNNSTSGITAGTGSTLRGSIGGAFGVSADNNGAISPPALTTMNFNISPGGENYWMSVALSPSPAFTSKVFFI